MAQGGERRMLAAERRQRIVDMLAQGSSVLVTDICREFGVSAVTVRGDLDYLEAEGRLRRTHGGAVPITEYAAPRPSEHERRNLRAKQAIARRVARLVGDDETVLVGSGSTTLEFVRALREREGVTVITNDRQIIEYVERRAPELTVVSTGGVLSRDCPHYFGPFVAASLADVYLDKVFLGADGFEPGIGFLAEYEQTAFAKVEFLRHARTRVILMDATKVGASSSYLRFARPDEVSLVVMDRDPDGAVALACGAGTRVIEALVP